GTGIEPDILALIEPFCISHHGVSRAKVQAGEKVLVMGGGAIGILAALTAKLQGAQVYVSDIAKEKLDFIAANFPVDGCVLNTGEDSISEAVGRITGGDGFDVTVEAAGAPQSFMTCVNAAASMGRMVQIGVSKKTVDFNFTLLQKKELNLMGSRAATRADFIQTMAYVRDGKADLRKLISKTYHAADAAEAFADLNENAGSIVKMELEF
ncbi:MAG: zinc-binding dehydrogenase, partial [Sphaerochaeta sp.]|nr:zinc-binding dehydrogenase [Sphaerochaeta sp.]